jgi:hypothetical protein
MKKIIVGGCSHVFGHGLPDCIEGITPSKLAWPSFIEKDFSCEIINFSEPGNSTTKIIRSIINYSEIKSVSAIIILLPFSKRRLLMHNNIEHNYTCTWPEYSKLFSHSLQRYEKYCHNESTDNVNFISYVGYLNYISIKYCIPLWLSGTIKEDQELLQSHGFEIGMPDDWSSFCYRKKYTTTPDGHWGPDAHVGLYGQYIKPWLVENIFK